jgi:hypothetical protein
LLVKVLADLTDGSDVSDASADCGDALANGFLNGSGDLL